MEAIPEFYTWQAYNKGMWSGDIVLVHGKGKDWLSTAISIGQSLSYESGSYWRHAMRVSNRYRHVYSQDWKFKERPLTDYAGCILQVFHNSAYTDDQRLQICQEAEASLGSPYDLAGLFGQLFRAVPFVGNWLKDAIEVPWLTYCSERVCLTERTQTPEFCGGGSCQVSPTDIAKWCREAGWETFGMFRLKV